MTDYAAAIREARAAFWRKIDDELQLEQSSEELGPKATAALDALLALQRATAQAEVLGLLPAFCGVCLTCKVAAKEYQNTRAEADRLMRQQREAGA